VARAATVSEAPVAGNPRHYKYYDLVMAGFVTVLLCSNIIGPGKVCQIWGFSFGAGNLFFPISYIFGDILTEVYGYGRDRRVVWAGFGALIFASVMAFVVISLPPNPSGWMKTYQPALETVFGNSFRIVAGSIIAFWCGSFANAYVLAKMKVWSNGKHLWMRTIGSTMVGELVDSLLFYSIAFYGLWATNDLIKVIAAQYILKTSWEVLMTPATYAIVGFLKRVEHEDYYDRDTNFSPFKIS
jgi:uncharacterized integral membrane protein (TIGR00697 family)